MKHSSSDSQTADQASIPVAARAATRNTSESRKSATNAEAPGRHAPDSGLLPQERRAALALSMVYGVRMLGLFIILPVFSVFAVQYKDSTPFLIGLGLGIYGLLQALLQIPFGMLSDRIGRKPVLIAGLLLFLAGSILAALADSIYTVIAGRALQGAGAVSAALIALAADLTRDEQRTKMMAVLGGSIGLAFVASLMLGPILANAFSLSGLFWFTAVSAVCAILLVIFVVPTPVTRKVSGDTVANVAGIRELVGHGQLLRLDISIFALHALVTASFVGIPVALVASEFVVTDHWKLYVPALVLSVAVMIPAIIVAEKHRKLRQVFLLCIVGLALSQLILLTGQHSVWMVFLAVGVFFSFFNTLEALLPSLVSKLAPPGSKGSAMGIYSSSQFFGAFVGGAGGGWLVGQFGLPGLFSGLLVLCAVWFVAALGLKNPKAVSSYLFAVGDDHTADSGAAVVAACLALPGVDDAVVVIEEGMAYLKIDRKIFDPESLQSIPVRIIR